MVEVRTSSCAPQSHQTDTPVPGKLTRQVSVELAPQPPSFVTSQRLHWPTVMSPSVVGVTTAWYVAMVALVPLPKSSSRTVPVFWGWMKILNVRASVSVKAPVPTDCSTQRGEAPAVSTATRVTLLTPSGETLGSSVKVSSVDPSGKMVFVWVTLGKGLAPYQG